MRYFRVQTDDVRFANRWFLGEPLTKDSKEIEARHLCRGLPYSGPRPSTIPVGVRGPRVAFNLAAFDMPVVSHQIASSLKNVASSDIECFPVEIDGIRGQYEILNVVALESCVDDLASRARKWTEKDGRPDMVGEYREFDPLIIDSNLARGRKVLRISGSLVELIVSEEIRDILEPYPNLGIVFEPVTR